MIVRKERCTMSILVFGYPILPAIIFCLALFIVVLLTTFRVKTRFKIRIAITSTLAGSVGFTLTFALPLYPPLHDTYLPVTFCFAGMAFFGIVACLMQNINPLAVGTPLFHRTPKPTKRANHLVDNTEENVFEQKIGDAYRLVDLLLFKLGKPHTYFKRIHALNEKEEVEFPFALINPYGVFLIYPYNWSGKIVFEDTFATKTLQAKDDMPDMISGIMFRQQLIQKIIATTNIKKVPLRSIVCTTNPSAIIAGSPKNYDVMDLGELAQHFRKMGQNTETLTPKELNILKEAFLLNNR